MTPRVEMYAGPMPVGARLMDLDAEDFDQTTFIPDPLVSLHQSSS